MTDKKEYVLAVAFSVDRRKILLIRKLTPEWQRGLLNGPGGKIEEGETPIQAMTREFKEETSVETTAEHWSSLGTIESDVFKVYVFCMFDDIVYQAKTVEREVVDMFQVDIDMLAECGVDNLHKIVELALTQ